MGRKKPPHSVSQHYNKSIKLAAKLGPRTIQPQGGRLYKKVRDEIELEDWEKLELAIANFEKILGPEAEIVYDDLIPDKESGELRQVDVSVRYKGKLVILECRRREEKQDVTWIEQAYGKRKSVGASRVILVSSSGFYETVLKKARKWKLVEVRTFEETSDEWVVKNWFGELVFSPIYLRFNLKEMIIGTHESYERGDTRDGYLIAKWNIPLFISKDNQSVLLNAIQFWERAAKQKLWDIVPPDTIVTDVTCEYVYTNRDSPYRMAHMMGPPSAIRTLRVKIDIWVNRELQLKPYKVIGYNNPLRKKKKEALIHSAFFEFQHKGMPHVAVIHHKKDEQKIMVQIVLKKDADRIEYGKGMYGTGEKSFSKLIRIEFMSVEVGIPPSNKVSIPASIVIPNGYNPIDDIKVP